MLCLFTSWVNEYSYLVLICDIVIGIGLFCVILYVLSRLREWRLRRW